MTTMEILSINNHVSQCLNKMVLEQDSMSRSAYAENVMEDVMKLSEALISGQDKVGELRVG